MKVGCETVGPGAQEFRASSFCNLSLSVSKKHGSSELFVVKCMLYFEGVLLSEKGF